MRTKSANSLPTLKTYNWLSTKELKQEFKRDDFKPQMQLELELIKNKPLAVPRLSKVASAACLAQPNKNSDPSFFDPTIVRHNSQGIDKV